MLCGCSISRQCNIFIGCKPHGRILRTNRSHYVNGLISCRVSTGRGSASESLRLLVQVPPVTGFFTRFCPLRHMRSERIHPISVLVERATPLPDSLSNNVNFVFRLRATPQGSSILKTDICEKITCQGNGGAFVGEW